MTTPRHRSRQIGSRRRQASVGAGHTWFVRITKLILPIAALVIVGVVVARLSQDKQQLQIAATPSQEKTTPGQIDLVKPKYEGLDSNNRPYTVSADTAHRIMGQEQIVALVNPKGDLELEDGSWLAAQAAQGLYNNTAGKMYLSGGVTLFHDSGYEMHLKDLDVDVRNKAAQSLKPVDGQGPAGRITAQNVAVTDAGDLIVFGGPATLTLWNKTVAKEKHG